MQRGDALNKLLWMLYVYKVVHTVKWATYNRSVFNTVNWCCQGRTAVYTSPIYSGLFRQIFVSTSKPPRESSISCDFKLRAVQMSTYTSQKNITLYFVYLYLECLSILHLFSCECIWWLTNKAACKLKKNQLNLALKSDIATQACTHV